METKEITGYELTAALDTLCFLNESTDDYLFLWEISTGKIYIGGKIYEKYPLPKPDDKLPHATVIHMDDWKKIVYSRDLQSLTGVLDKIKNGTVYTQNMEYRILDKEDNKIWINCRGKSRMDEDGNPLMMIGRVSDTAMNTKVDRLTGLFNSDKFSEDLKGSLQEKQTGYLLILGIDNFKNVNIKHGRGFGNYILKTITEILENSVEGCLNIYRLDGDRFAVNMSGKTQKDVQELYACIQKKAMNYCTLSAGAVFYGEDFREDSGMLHQYAENALDCAKKDGKNVLAFFSSDDYREDLNNIALQEEMRQSINEDFRGFYLCYQPQIDCRDYRIFGVEALLRYDSPTQGKMKPSQFIPMLEQTGLICQVGDWVLLQALLQCEKWREQISNFHISVNISYVQLAKEGIAEKVLSMIKQTGLPGDALTLEVTESIQLQNYQYFNKIFYKWKKFGIKISIDDFGTGYSSLSYLKSIEVDEIKIDRCFVSHIQYSVYNQRLLNNMVDLAHSAQIKVCCEGVETEEELLTLKKLNPDTLQGYLFARPHERDKFEDIYINIDSPSYIERKEIEDYLHSLDEEQDQEFLKNLSKEELGIIAEEMDEVIYISDINSYELYYLNPAGRRVTGIYDYKGCKCYKVLQGKDSPCEFCTNQDLKGYEYHVWEMENKYLNRHFIIKDKMIPWKGKTARMEISIDVTEREVVSNNIQKKLEFEKNIMDCCRLLVAEFDAEKAISTVLTSIGEIYQADRAYIFEPSEDSIHWKNTYEWCREGVACQKDELQEVPPHVLRRWMGIFRNNASVILEDCDAIRTESPDEWEVLKSQNITSLIAAPIWKDSRLIGFVGVDNPKDRQDDESVVHAMAYFLGGRMEPANQERNAELEHMRKNDFYEAMLTETAAYAEISVDSGQIKAAGGLWESYAEECRKWGKTFNQIIESHLDETVLAEDREKCRKCLDTSTMKNMYRQGRTSRKVSFRRYIDGEAFWMELVVHVFQERFTENTYALLYFKNIDVEKKRELAWEVEARKDPLTNIYNRRTFERELVRFMTSKREENPCGALALLDLDDFKSINDLYGHPAGDKVLKRLTKLLLNTFRQKDIVGRFGGDEFLVFIKGVTKREILNKRMEELFAMLKNSEEIAMTCSVGIVCMEKEGFSYEEALKKADIALYKSKQKGKNRYCYYDDME